MQNLGIMGIDQYGTHYDGLVHPRRDLLARLGYKHAEKMFQDSRDGNVKHVGYVIGGLWITLYTVCSWERGES